MTGLWTLCGGAGHADALGDLFIKALAKEPAVG